MAVTQQFSFHVFKVADFNLDVFSPSKSSQSIWHYIKQLFEEKLYLERFPLRVCILHKLFIFLCLGGTVIFDDLCSLPA